MPLARGLDLVLALGHELEAGEGVIAADPVALGHDPRHVGRHERLERHCVRREGPRAALGPDQIVQQQHARLVARELDVLPVPPAHLDRHAVGVGVGAEDEVGPHLLGQLHGQREALGVLGVGGGDGGEGPVDHHLLRHTVQPPDAQLMQDVGDLLIPGPVEGGVDHGEPVGDLGDRRAVVDLVEDAAEEGVVGLLADRRDQPGGAGVLIGHGLHVAEDVEPLHPVGDGGGVLGRELRAVGPVDLVAVVLRRVVAGGDVQPRDAPVVAHGEGQLRRGAHGVEQPHGDAVGGHDAGGLPREAGGIDAAVVADGHAAAGGVRPLGEDHLGEGLGGVADDVDVHAARAEADDAAQPGGAELEEGEEAVLDLLLIEGGEGGVLLVGEGRALAPGAVSFTIVHEGSSLYYRVVVI